MMRKRYSERKIISILKEHERGASVADQADEVSALWAAWETTNDLATWAWWTLSVADSDELCRL